MFKWLINYFKSKKIKYCSKCNQKINKGDNQIIIINLELKNKQHFHFKCANI